MARATSSTMVSGSQLYSYLEIDGRGTNATASYYDLRGGVTSGFYWDLTCSSFLKWWENGSGHDIDSGSGYYGGYSDLQLVSSDSFAVTRTSSDRYITFECYSTSSLGSGSARYTVEVPHLPGAPTNLTATRISDNRIDLSWTNPSLPYGGFYLQVSIDGGSWSNAWSVENVMPTSYSYTAASAGHSYKFRAYTGHWYAYSAYSNETAIITMTPSAPQSISVAASGGTNVTVTLANDSAVATSLEYQTSTDGGSTWSASTEVSGSPVTSFSTSVSGTALIRVRNKNATGVSDWLVSDPITTICPPAPPTLRTPSGSVYDMAQGDIEFSWLHNSLDGSMQTAYQLRYAINGGAWTTLSGTTAQSRTVSLGTFSVGNAVTWQVRTKGADANYSDWSQTGAFSVYTAPTLSITSPGATITGMPISLTATYSDMAGFTCQTATVSLTQNGMTLFSEPATINGSSITSSLDVSEFLPTNGETYTVVVTARSSSSLQTSANATFTVDFVEPQAGELQITNDPETGYASLLATFDNSASEITYTGSTNEQYESTEGYVRSLTVEGKSEAHNSPNLYDPSESVSGYLIAGGSVMPAGSDTNERTSDFIPVTAGETYVFQVWVTPTQSARDYLWMAYILYDSAKSAVGSRPSKTAGANTGTPQHASFIIEIPSGISYIRLSARMYDDGRMMLEHGETESDYQPFPYIESIEGVSVGDGTITTLLRSAGSVHDTLMADADSWTVRRKVGVVDLGTLSWTKSTYSQAFIFKSTIAGIKRPDAQTPNQVNALCTAIGKVISWNLIGTPVTVAWDFAVSTSTDDIAFGFPNSYTDISDAAAFKTAMSGVLLYYELATPTVDTETSMSRIEIGSAFTVQTDLDSTFELTTWDGSADAVSISVSRVNADGTLTPLLTEGASGSGIVDKYAPLNTPYQYAVTTKASSQAVKTVYVDNIIESDYWFAYWGDNVAKAKWNPDNGGIQVTRPSKTRVYYAGRRDPVSYDGRAVALTETPSWMFIGKDEVDAFVKLIEDGGRGIYKSCDGWVYHADFDLTLTPSYTAIGYYGGASLGITRIAGERL